MEDYINFKNLLEYFVAHLEWVTTKDKNNLGYQSYIAPLVDKNNFYATGQGYKGDNIQTQIKKWSHFTNGKVYLNIQGNYGNYKTVKCYLNWAETGLNIIAKWNNNSIESLALEEYLFWLTPTERVDLKTNKSLLNLGLFDNKEPNDAIQSFFNKFESLIINWKKNQQKKKNMESTQPYISLLEQTHNLILTGAPGTGKTYLAKQIAKQMIGIESDKELEESNQFAFVQFHPSYDYTDFVEGLRPTKPDSNGNIGFELKNGIFKEFCKKAIGVNAITLEHIDNFTLTDYERYLKTIGLSDDTIKNYKLRIDQLLGKEIKAKRQLEDRIVYSSLDEICEGLNEIKDFDVTNNFHNQFSAAVSNLINFKSELSIRQNSENKAKQPFIFIIDEINRGEISKIFGELFFSIDPSYRGKKGAVKTQFSNLHEDENEVFFVPDNVYIIGSMNDIDRSVESFDFAMRRRFTWKEITAEQSAINMNLNEEAKRRMTILNGEISKIEGLNSSYHIGSAYFLDKNGVQTVDYEAIWKFRLEPLLKEYLRGLPGVDDKLETLKSVYSI